MTLPLSLYIHIPFCRIKCSYCDFNTYAGLDDSYESYVQALSAEIRAMGRYRQRPEVKTIFIGGGTPTVLSVSQLASILAACDEAFDVLPGAEITSEANPATVDEPYLRELLGLGVKRFSFGAQSFNADELKMLGRLHSVEGIGDTVKAARRAGADNLNLDLIYGLPQQTLDAWRYTLEQTIALEPEHISLYSLTLERGTALHAQVARGEFPPPDSDLDADMYELADKLLAAAGYTQYEISNWSKPGRKCQHNLTYWRNRPYLGFGPGAHSFMIVGTEDKDFYPPQSPLQGGKSSSPPSCEQPKEGWRGEKFHSARRWWNIRSVPKYIETLNTLKQPTHPHPSMADWEEIDHQLEMAETVILGLRLTQEGVSLSAFRARFGQSLCDVFGPQVDKLKALNLLIEEDQRLRLTPQARLLGNQVFMRFLPEMEYT